MLKDTNKFVLLEPVNISKKAAAEIRVIMKKKGLSKAYYLRIGIKSGGCSSIGYHLGFDKKAKNDIHYTRFGVPIVMDKKYVMHLIDIEVHYQNDPDSKGFYFQKKEV